MSLPDHFASDFPPAIQTRGDTYRREGRVRIMAATEHGIEAEVSGTHSYAVSIAWDDAGTIAYGCSCPYARDTGPCKHIWATLVDAEARGFPLPIPLWPDDEELGELEPRLPPPARAARHPAWRLVLQNVGRQMAAEPARPVASPARGEQRLVYVIDTPKTTMMQSGLYIDVMVEARRRDGAWGAPKTMTIGNARWDAIADPADREIAQLLLGARQEYAAWNAAPPRGAASFALPVSAFEVTLPRLCATGRCRVRHTTEDRVGVPLAWDPGEPWEPRILFVRDGGARYRLHLSLRRGDERLPGGEPSLLLHGGLLIHGGTAARLRTHDAIPLLAAIAAPSGMIVGAAELPEVIAELLSLPHLPPVQWPEELAIEEAHPEMRPRLRLERPRRYAWRPDLVMGALSFGYGDLMVDAGHAGAAMYERDARRIVHRDRAAERAAIQRLHGAGFRDDYDYDTGALGLAIAPARIDEVVLALLAERWDVELSGRRYIAPGASRIDLRSGIDWFELEAGVEFGDQRAMSPELLAALHRGDRVVTLADGSVGMLPAHLLRDLARVAEMGTVAEGRVRFARSQVGLLDALLAALPEITTDDRFARAREELHRFERIEPLEPPAGFTGELRPYQREGLGWLDFLRRFGFGGCLADDMGLGKTVQLLALLQMRALERGGPSLIVVPRSLVFNWRREAARFTPGLRVLDHSGAQRRREVEHFDEYDLVLTTYGTLRRDAAMFKDVEFDYVVLDEAQAIKNASTASAKAARLLHARHRLALTGTPVENHLGDLWSLFEFLNPGMLGTAAAFKRLRAGTAIGQGTEATDGSRELLARAVRPFILRRTKEQVARELPEKLEQTVYVDLEPAERKLYDQLRDHYRATLLARVGRVGMAKSKMQVLEALLRLRQAACHPGLLDKARASASSSKLDALVPQVVEVIEGGHKALVFSQFTSLLAILRERLDAEGVTYEYLDGRTRDRERRVARFQGDPACPVFLISLKAGGVGLNLTAADYVFLLDPWWNPAIEAQAIDRAHRIGQARRVFASRLIARDTVEERVLELQDAKRDLAQAIVGEDSGLIARIGRAELEELLR
ncbi:MAG TPA: DEAD/DEAH box helicase [Gemmatimonadaceae bacterium]|nr:DEAD/DEAH box helicase [Gemmatimonadaceae bacterium]